MKKSWIFIVVLLTCLSVSSYAQSASELFQQANDFRVSGDVDQALELYQRVKVLDHL